MTDRAPVEVTNLDRYGSAALPWSRPRDLLAASPTQSGITVGLGLLHYGVEYTRENIYVGRTFADFTGNCH